MNRYFRSIPIKKFTGYENPMDKITSQLHYDPEHKLAIATQGNFLVAISEKTSKRKPSPYLKEIWKVIPQQEAELNVFLNARHLVKCFNALRDAQGNISQCVSLSIPKDLSKPILIRCRESQSFALLMRIDDVLLMYNQVSSSGDSGPVNK